VQASHSGHMNVVKELLNHGANVTMNMIYCPVNQRPVKEQLEQHLIVYVFFLTTRAALLFKSLIA